MIPTPTTPREAELAQRLTTLEHRVHAVEQHIGTAVPVTAPAPAPAAPAPAPVSTSPSPSTHPSPSRQASKPTRRPAHSASATTHPRPAAPRAPQPPAFDLERFFGGHVLAWVGGLAVLAALVLLYALGVSSGWIGPVGRTATGGGIAGLLVLVGLWLHERQGRTEAARASVAAGAGGLFLSMTVAARVYDLIPPAVGLTFAAVVAGATALLAVRWSSPVIGSIGLIGALLGPVLAGAALDVTTLTFLFVAAVGSSAVLVHERWTWLSVAVFVIPAAYVLVWLVDEPAALAVVAVLTAFGAVNVVAALGVDIRSRETPLRLFGAYLLGANALLLAVAGWWALDVVAGETAAIAWLAALAVAHAAVGMFARARNQISSELALLSLALATLVADVALALTDVSGPVKAVAWGLAATGLAWLGRRAGGTAASCTLLDLGVGGQVALTLVQAAVLFDPSQALGPGADASVVVALLALASCCLVSGRLAQAGHREWRIALDVIGLLAAALMTTVVLDGVALTGAWAAAAVVLGQVAGRDDDALARVAAFVHLAGATVWCLIDQALPTVLVNEPSSWVFAGIGAGALLLSGARLLHLSPAPSIERRALWVFLALIPMYLGSVAALAIGEADGAGFAPAQQGQLALSALWAIVGVAAMVVGLRRDLRDLRVAGLGMLAVTIGKVFLYDLATLTSGWRIASFLALGLVLLGAGFAYQRLRPEVDRFGADARSHDAVV